MTERIGNPVLCGVFTGSLISNTFHGVSSQGLLLSMNFNADSINGTTVLDSSGVNNHGTVVGATWAANTGFKGGGAYEFGVGDKITIPTITKSVWTMSIWLYPTAFTSAFIMPIGSVNSFITRRNNGLFRVQDDEGTYNDINTDIPSLDTWQLWTVVNDGSDYFFYIDGIYEGTAASGGRNFTFTEMGDTLNGTFDYIGTIDNPLIYDRALSADEVKQLYNQRAESLPSYVSQKDIQINADGSISINGALTLSSAGVVRPNHSIMFDQDVDSAAVADQVSISGYDLGVNERALAISQECAVAVEVDETKFSHKMPIRINGATYFMMLTAT